MSPTSSSRSTLVRTLNSLLRSEISAAESYTQIIPRIGAPSSTDLELLRKIAVEHGQAVERIRAEIERAGGTPAEASGGGPALTKTLSGPAHVFADAIALTALKEGEARSLELYREALPRMNGQTAALIRDSLIPAQLQHIDALEKLLEHL